MIPVPPGQDFETRNPEELQNRQDVLRRDDGKTHLRRDDDRLKLLFIGGLGRSGSTLIERLLNELPSMFAVGETIHVWERGVQAEERCGCGEPFVDCPHWTAVGNKAFGGWDNVDLDDVIGLRWSVDRSRRLPMIEYASRTGSVSDEQSRYLSYLRRVLHGSSSVAGTPAVLLESSKHVSTAALLALDPTIDLRILHLVRDPRGVAYSWTKQVHRPETDGDLMPTYSHQRTARRWVTDNLAFEALAQRVPSIQLRYEDFLEGPGPALEAITELVDLDPASIDLSFLDGRTATLTSPMHSVAGNPLRFGGDVVELRLDDAWRQQLSRRQQALITGITSPLLLRYGYPLR